MGADCCGGNASFEGLSVDYRRRLWLVIGINAAMFVVEIMGGVLAGSQALQADALDFLGDTLTYGLSLAVIGMGLRVRATAALFKGASLSLMGLWVFGSTAYHVFVLGVPRAEVMGAIGFLALAANVASVLILMKYQEGDANVRSVWLCSRNDAIGNVAVIIAALAVFATGTAWPDLIVAAIMAALFLNSSGQILVQAMREYREQADRAMRHPRSRAVLPLTAAAAAALLVMPHVLATYPLIILCHMLVFAIVCLAFNLVYGTAGMLSFGHATYFGVAAYAGAFLYRFTEVGSFEIYLVFGVLCATVFAAVIGFLSCHRTSMFFSILTLAFSMLVYSLVIDGAVFRLFGGLGWALYLLGGGSMYLPRLPILGIEFGPLEFIVTFFHVIAVCFLASAVLLWRIGASPFGQALRAIRDNDTRAAFIGIPVRAYRWYAFIISGLFTGLAGGLYGQLARQITPEQLHWLFSAQIAVATVLGGARHFLGPLLGAMAFVAIDEVASQWAFGRYLTFGALLIFVVLVFPQGMAGGIAAIMVRLRRLPAWRPRPLR
jgi:ABC-type branched-subunit amino acid transport system permease subunit/Co/Zn/Cd efflux system component